MDEWWIGPMQRVFEGRRVVLAGDVASVWGEHVGTLRAAGATDLMVVATAGRGAGTVPDLPTVIVDPPPGLSFLERVHFGIDTLERPPAHVREALAEFDPDREALVVGTFLNTAAELDGRPMLAHRRPEWVALEDKTVVDDFWRRAGVRHAPSSVVPLGEASRAAAALDEGEGTVWAADAREGFNGGGSGIRWVVDEATATTAHDELTPMCDGVRVMPFLEGVPCSIHGIVLPDGVAVLRPVEMVTLRSGNRFVYAGCATFWDPPSAVREEMRDVARTVGAHLAAEVDFRGTFTVDGVATSDGFVPTELNPRFGAGINVIARASGLPILLANDLIVAGEDLGVSAETLEDQLMVAADEHRGGGTWISGSGSSVELAGDPVVDDGGEFRWAGAADRPSGDVVATEAFVRCRYAADVVPRGPSTGPRAAAFWRFADRELGTRLGPLVPAADLHA